MSQPANVFVEFHVLTSFVPSNLNRDDLGSPKTAIFGGHRRLRVSSQCLKRTWRVSEAFRGELAPAQLGLRTQRVGAALRERLPGLDKKGAEQVSALLLAMGKKGAAGKEAPEEEGEEEAGEGAGAKGGVEGGGDGETNHLLFVSRAELDAMAAYVKEGLAKKKKLDPKELEEHLRKACDRNAVDVSLFGRFLTTADKGKSAFTTDAALQVAHGLGTQKIDIEYDFYSAVDDLSGDSGAGHIGEVEFASSVLYLYAVCDVGLLRKNLGADAGSAGKALAAVAKAMARTVPTGKKNGTAPHNPADYLGVVVRRDAPVSLANAFLTPVRPGRDGDRYRDTMDNSVHALRRQALRYDEAYGAGGVVGRTTLCLREGVAEASKGEVIVGSLDELSRRLGEQIAAGGAS
jgi:CRISPR system Cascade subunit CasC